MTNFPKFRTYGTFHFLGADVPEVVPRKLFQELRAIVNAARMPEVFPMPDMYRLQEIAEELAEIDSGKGLDKAVTFNFRYSPQLPVEVTSKSYVPAHKGYPDV